jgi:Raf kinase inhibitor-like YbhB/YbcL family protein
MSIEISSGSFGNHQPIPVSFTADGGNVSPELRWSGVPAGTKELALIVDDPDAPKPEPFVHWVAYKISAEATCLPQGLPQTKKLHDPPGMMQGLNSFGDIGYDGPAPPKGHGTHHYHFRVYALDEPLEVQPGVDHKALLASMAGHVLDEGELVGTYVR